MTLPSFLNRTPEQIRDEQHRQQMLRDLHLKGASQTPAEQRIARAMMAEDAIRKNLALLLPGSDAHRATEIELAEVLAEQGKFREAASTGPMTSSATVRRTPLRDATHKARSRFRSRTRLLPTKSRKTVR
jgi:hypothetical protein